MPADFLEALAVAAAHYLPEHEFSAMPADLPQTKYTGNKPYTGKLPTGTVGRKVALPPPPLIHGTDAAGYRTSFAPTGGATKAAADPYTGTFGPKPPPPPEMVRLKEPSHSDFQVPFPADAHREHLSGLASIAKSNPAALHRDDHAALLRHFSTQANRFSDRVKRGEKVWQGEADHFQDASQSLSNHMTMQQQFSRRSTPEEIAADEAEPTHIRRLKMPDHKDFHTGYSYGETFHGHVNDMADLAVADPSRIHPDDHPALHHYFGKNLHIKRMGQASKILREHAAKPAEPAKKPEPQKPNYRVTFSRDETEFARKTKPAAGQKSMFGDDDDEPSAPAPAPAAQATTPAKAGHGEWDEDLHPRGDHGKWALAESHEPQPNHIHADVRDHEGETMGYLSHPHDGTTNGIRAAHAEAKEGLTSAGHDWSSDHTRWGATDHTGEPRHHISHDGQQLTDVADPRNAQRGPGGFEAPPKKARPAPYPKAPEREDRKAERESAFYPKQAAEPAIPAHLAEKYPSLVEPHAAPEPEQHWYGMRLRPPSIGAIPKGDFDHQPHDEFRHGQISYGRKLSDQEVGDYQLTPIRNDSEIPELTKKFAAGMGKYAKEYAKPENDEYLNKKLNQSEARMLLGHVDPEKIKAELRKQHGAQPESEPADAATDDPYENTPRRLFGHDTDAAKAAGWRFHTDEVGYNGNRPKLNATSPTGDLYQWNGTMTHGGGDPWELVWSDKIHGKSDTPSSTAATPPVAAKEDAPVGKPASDVREGASDGRESVSNDTLFKRSGQQFEEIQKSLGITKPQMGQQGADAVRKALASRVGGPVIAEMLKVHEHSPDAFARHGFATGTEAYRDSLSGKFSKEQLLDASRFAAGHENGDMSRFVRDSIRGATATDGGVSAEDHARAHQAGSLDRLAKSQGADEAKATKRQADDLMVPSPPPTGDVDHGSASNSADSFSKAFKEGRVEDAVAHIAKLPLSEGIAAAGDFGLPVYSTKTKKALLESVRRIAEHNTPDKVSSRTKQEGVNSANQEAKQALDNAEAHWSGRLGAPIRDGVTEEQSRSPHATGHREAVAKHWSDEVGEKFAKLEPSDPTAKALIAKAKQLGIHDAEKSSEPAIPADIAEKYPSLVEPEPSHKHIPLYQNPPKREGDMEVEPDSHVTRHIDRLADAIKDAKEGRGIDAPSIQSRHQVAKGLNADELTRLGQHLGIEDTSPRGVQQHIQGKLEEAISQHGQNTYAAAGSNPGNRPDDSSGAERRVKAAAAKLVELDDKPFSPYWQDKRSEAKKELAAAKDEMNRSTNAARDSKPEAAKQPTLAEMARAAAGYQMHGMRNEPDDKAAWREHTQHMTKSAVDAWLMQKFGVDSATARGASNAAGEMNPFTTDGSGTVGGERVRWTHNSPEPTMDELGDMPWMQPKQDATAKPFRPEAVPGQQMGMFGEERSGQKQLFNVVKPKRGDKPQAVAPSELEKIGDEIDARQAERQPLAGQKSIEEPEDQEDEKTFPSQSEVDFAKTLAQKHGSPVSPVTSASGRHELASRFSNMLERAAGKSTDELELEQILSAAKGKTDESRVAWAIANNPHSSDAVFEKAKANEAMREMSPDSAISHLDARRAELRKNRGLAAPSQSIEEQYPSLKEPEAVAKQPHEMTKDEYVRQLPEGEEYQRHAKEWAAISGDKELRRLSRQQEEHGWEKPPTYSDRRRKWDTDNSRIEAAISSRVASLGLPPEAEPMVRVLTVREAQHNKAMVQNGKTPEQQSIDEPEAVADKNASTSAQVSAKRSTAEFLKTHKDQVAKRAKKNPSPKFSHEAEAEAVAQNRAAADARQAAKSTADITQQYPSLAEPKAEDSAATEPAHKQYDIYETHARNHPDGARTMHAVAMREDGKRGFGDTLHNTHEEAVAHIEHAKVAAKNKQEWQAKVAADEADKEKAKAEKNDLGGYESTLSAASRGKAVEHLDKLARLDGKDARLKDHVKRLVEAGEVTSTRDEDKVKPMTRTQFNRADNAQQEAHEKKMKAGGTKTNYLLGGWNVGKLAHDYANHLIAKKGAADITKQYPSLAEPKAKEPHEMTWQEIKGGHASERAAIPSQVAAAESEYAQARSGFDAESKKSMDRVRAISAKVRRLNPTGDTADIDSDSQKAVEKLKSEWDTISNRLRDQEAPHRSDFVAARMPQSKLPSGQHEHRTLVAKAISDGKIASHPDYPELSEKDEQEPEMNGWSPENHVKVAADSIQKLRGQDVYRLLDSAPPEGMEKMAKYILKHRPELVGDIRDAKIDIQDERGQQFSREEETCEGATCSPREALVKCLHECLNHDGQADIEHEDTDGSIESMIPADPSQLDRHVAETIRTFSEVSPKLAKALAAYQGGRS